MTDHRFHPANARVAAVSLRGDLTGVSFVDGVAKSINTPVADLWAAPDGPRDRQLLGGTAVTVYETHNDCAFVQAPDGYVGYVAARHIGPLIVPTHRVATLATHAYTREDMKSPDCAALPFGVRVTVIDERRKFFETDLGFIPKAHLRPLDRPFADPATLAQMHFGTPYLWGGNSTRGIDCSGLIAACLHACDIDCAADSDIQKTTLGVDTTTPPKRGDLVFWAGHVGMMVDAETLIHANAHHMATRYEPLTQATLRIKAQGDGPMLRHARLD